MGFIDEAQAWVRAGMLPDLPPDFDIEGCRRAMWATLEIVFDPAYVHRLWVRPGMLERAARIAVAELRRGLGASWSASELSKYAAESVAIAIMEGNRPQKSIVDLELNRISSLIAALASNNEIGPWCAGLRLVDGAGTKTSTGEVFTRLVGREALQFALELEAALSMGVRDPLRASRVLLRELRKRELCFDDGLPPYDIASFSYESLKRLAAMGVVHHWDRDSEDRFLLEPEHTDLVDTVIDPAPNPIRALVHALLEAERGRVLTEQTGLPQQTSDLGFARMVIHELRNITLPLSTATSQLWSELSRSGGPDPARVSALRERIERSVDRVGSFARDSARLLQATEPEPLSLRDVVEEAVRATEADRNGRIAVDHAGLTQASIVGPRPRWVLLFVNLLRNAAQARAGKGTVWISNEWDLIGKLRIFVDDDGPGVPEELREQIFEQGVSTRGGTGSGLFDARTTVILAGGALTCEASPRGGARFHLHVPARRV